LTADQFPGPGPIPPGRPGPPLARPRGGSPSSGGDERILRDRLAALDAALDRAAQHPEVGAQRMLVKIYNGGSMATLPDHIFLGHPVLLTGGESEGGTATQTVDSNTVVPVVALQHVPAAGDVVVATMAGGRWVIDKGTAPPTGTCFLTACSPCALPQVNFQIAWTNVIDGNGSATMTYDPATSTWLAQCVDSGLSFRIGCTSGTIELRAIFYTSGGCPGGSSNYCSNLRGSPLALTLSAHTCSPFSLTFDVTESGCNALYSRGNTQFVITATPDPATMACPVCVRVRGCKGAVLANVSVSIDGGPAATTNSGGIAIVDAGSAGPHTITVTDPDGLFNVYSGDVDVTCGVGLSDITLTPISGYHCSCMPTALPYPDTLNFSSGSTGALTLTWAASSPLGTGVPMWYSDQFDYHLGCGSCDPVTVSAFVAWGAEASSTGSLCPPVATFPAYATFIIFVGNITCPGIGDPVVQGSLVWGAGYTGTLHPLNVSWTHPNDGLMLCADDTATLTE
jgi:hypothetical protein